jgi:pectate lyase
VSFGYRMLMALLAMGMINVSRVDAQVKAFPQAEGFGAVATGGRGGDVYHVTSLLDDNSPGTLRYGMANAPSGGRTIVFDVGGWINLTSKLGLTRNRITIAGQTAPGGVGLRGAQFSVGGDDVIVRHLRFRPGKATNTDHDSVNTNDDAQRVIYDHISAEFSTDGGFDLQADQVTLQYSSVSFGLISHSTGGLIQSPTGGAAGELSFHHNLFAHNQTRNPKARAELIDWRDNVVYNFHDGFIAGDSQTDVNPNWKANFDGNTYISNIGGNSGSGGRPMMTGGRTQNYDLYYGENALDRDSDSADDPIVYTRAQAMSNQQIVSSAYNWSDTPFPAPEVWQSGSPAAAYARVLAEFGATPWNRDAVNQLIYNQVLSRTGSRISNENQLPIANAGYPTLGGQAAPVDRDGDGIADDWETKHGLSASQPSHNGDFDGDGYTNLEEYLNDLAAFKAIGALEFDGSGRYADSGNWTRSWEPSRVDDVHINVGVATVDAVGQKAGTLVLGVEQGSSGRLSIASGWIEITDDFVVGQLGAGAVSHTGGTAIVLNGGVTVNDAYSLSGGELKTPRLDRGASGQFSFTGGTLKADVVSFSLTNEGGVLAPGDSPGQTHIEGDLNLQAGTLRMELAGDAAGQHDRLLVDGALAAGGALEVLLIDGFAPAAGDSFDLVDFASVSGSFALSLPTLADGLTWNTASLLTTGVVSVESAAGNPADFNGDGAVDGEDLGAWRLGFGSTGQTSNTAGDADGDGSVDGADFLVWQQVVGAAAASSAAVPEPAARMLALLATGLLRGYYRALSD